MKLICKLLLVGILFNNFVYSQLPSSLLGSYEVISDLGLDQLVFEKDKVIGKLDGEFVITFLFEKKKEEYYYFKVIPLEKETRKMTNKNSKKESEEIDRTVNVRSRTSSTTYVNASNQSLNNNNVKVKIEMKEND